MIPLVVFFVLMAVLSVWDARKMHLPNLIVIPAMLIASVLLKTGQVVGITFLIGLLIYDRQKIAGGDTKLWIMVSAFLGWIGLLVLPLAFLLVKLYRKLRDNYAPLAVAPFMTVASVLIVIADYLIKQFCFKGPVL